MHPGCRQVGTLTDRVDKLPSPEDWNIMEQALAAILDEAATRAEEEDRLAEQEAAQKEGGPLGYLEEDEAEEAAEASSEGNPGAIDGNATFAHELLHATQHL